MLEPPHIPEDEIVARARAAYELRISSIEHLPVGNDSGAWSFRLTTDDGRRFLKLLTRRVDPASLAVPRSLVDHGIAGPVAPIPTAAGDLVDAAEDFRLVLYPFVDGEMRGRAGLPAACQTELGRVLRAIHDLTPPPDLAAAMRREDFAVPLAASIRHLAVRIDEPAGDDLHRELAAIWAARRDEIDRIVARTESLGRLAADRDPPLVICHADVHAWNVLVTPDEGIAIVDWDGTFLAPRECDLMFVGDRGGGMEHDAGAFAAGYGQLDADPVVAAFYRYRWVTEEIDDYARRVLAMPDLGRETRVAALESFAGLFDPGEVVEAARRSDPDLDP